MTPCIEHQAFDSAVFGCPFYRVKAFDHTALAPALAELCATRPLIIDAKIGADQVATGRLLLDCGFRKITTQIALTITPGEPPRDDIVASRPTLEMPDAVIAAHAENFMFDRFSLDPKLPVAGKTELYRRWVRNTLRSGEKEIVAIDHNFCSFADDGSAFRIDLVSVLDKRRGVGARLLRSVVALAAARGRARVDVVTECENRLAVALYLRNEFRFDRFFSVFHFVAP